MGEKYRREPLVPGLRNIARSFAKVEERTGRDEASSKCKSSSRRGGETRVASKEKPEVYMGRGGRPLR